MGLIRTLDGGEVRLLPQALEALKATLCGDILTRESVAYENARTVWNALVDRRPALIARCADAGDVQRIVRFAVTHNLLTSVRGGGHSIAGDGLCDGGVVIDLTRMRRVQVDALTRTACVDAGCTLADIDRATQAYGLATPLGVNSTTGIGGLALGGGFGWLSRKHGMTIDNLISAEIVTADGSLLRTSEAEHADLFWAIRGGGGNFGVVTRFELALHPVGPEILAGLIVHPLEHISSVLRCYRDFTAHAPDELSVWAVLRQAPPLPFLPAEWYDREVCILAAFYAGTDLAEGERLLAPLREHGRPIGAMITAMPYANWQQAFDPLLAAGACNYWKSHDFAQLSDYLLTQLHAQLSQLPSPECEIIIAQVGGMMGRVPPNRTAYPNRATRYIMNVHSRWRHATHEEKCMQWARDTFRATMPYATGSVYVNFMTADEMNRVGNAYGLNHAHLVAAKTRYDPRNFFRINHNIRPSPSNTGRVLERRV